MMNRVPAPELRGQRLPRRHVQDDAEMAHRNVLPVDQAGRVGHPGGADPVRDDLVPVEIEIDPVVGRAAFGATEESAVEAARLAEIGNRKGKVEARVVRRRQVSCS